MHASAWRNRGTVELSFAGLTSLVCDQGHLPSGNPAHTRRHGKTSSLKIIDLLLCLTISTSGWRVYLLEQVLQCTQQPSNEARRSSQQAASGLLFTARQSAHLPHKKDRRHQPCIGCSPAPVYMPRCATIV